MLLIHGRNVIQSGNGMLLAVILTSVQALTINHRWIQLCCGHTLQICRRHERSAPSTHCACQQNRKNSAWNRKRIKKEALPWSGSAVRNKALLGQGLTEKRYCELPLPHRLRALRPQEKQRYREKFGHFRFTFQPAARKRGVKNHV